MRARAQLVRLFDFEPDLLESVPDDERAVAAERVVVETMAFPAGPVDLTTLPEPDRAVGLLILDGLVTHRVEKFGRRAVELLGEGDVLRPDPPPWLRDPGASTWVAVSPVRVALLGHRFQREVARWPALVGALIDRVAARSSGLSVQLAIAQMPSVETRLLALLWSFAQRWGTVEPRAVSLRLPLGQGVLAELVSARRPSVNSALRRLRKRGLVMQVATGHWLLVGEPPAGLGAPQDERPVLAG